MSTTILPASCSPRWARISAALTAGTVGDQPTTVLIAGDDADAKNTLAEVVPLVACAPSTPVLPLRRARELERIGILSMTLAAAETISWTGGFAVQN